MKLWFAWNCLYSGLFNEKDCVSSIPLRGRSLTTLTKFCQLLTTYIKISWFRKDILVSSNLPKNQWNFSSRKRLNQKNKCTLLLIHSFTRAFEIFRNFNCDDWIHHDFFTGRFNISRSRFLKNFIVNSVIITIYIWKRKVTVYIKW